MLFKKKCLLFLHLLSRGYCHHSKPQTCRNEWSNYWSGTGRQIYLIENKLTTADLAEQIVSTFNEDLTFSNTFKFKITVGEKK